MFTKSNCKIKNGFTLIELLVVISIIVLLAALSLKGISRAVANAKINKATAEMTSLASTGASIYIDLKSRGYVRLCDYDLTLAGITNLAISLINPATFPGDPAPPPAQSNPRKINIAAGYALTEFRHGDDFASLIEFQQCWNGPRDIYQSKSTFNPLSAPPIGKYPNAGGVALLPANNGNPILWSPDKFPTDTPIDPWSHPYGMGWNIAEQVMVIYSAGPDGDFQTNPDGAIVTAGNDDLLYKFR